MEVKEAIATAKSYVQSVYTAAEITSDVGLEEVEFDQDEKHWRITVGFSQPSNAPTTRAREVLDRLDPLRAPIRRVQKILTIANDDGQVLSMKNP